MEREYALHECIERGVRSSKARIYNIYSSLDDSDQREPSPHEELGNHGHGLIDDLLPWTNGVPRPLVQVTEGDRFGRVVAGLASLPRTYGSFVRRCEASLGCTQRQAIGRDRVLSRFTRWYRYLRGGVSTGILVDQALQGRNGTTHSVRIRSVSVRVESYSGFGLVGRKRPDQISSSSIRFAKLVIVVVTISVVICFPVALIVLRALADLLHFDLAHTLSPSVADHFVPQEEGERRRRLIAGGWPDRTLDVSAADRIAQILRCELTSMAPLKSLLGPPGLSTSWQIGPTERVHQHASPILPHLPRKFIHLSEPSCWTRLPFFGPCHHWIGTMLCLASHIGPSSSATSTSLCRPSSWHCQ